MKRLPFAVIVFMTLVGTSAKSQDLPAILDSLQRTAFNFFWNEANPSTGLVCDHASMGGITSYPSSIASTGFGLSAICIGVDHGWVTRQQAGNRVLTTLRSLYNAPQGSGNGYAGMYGLFYHFLDMATVRRALNSELSTIDTALLLAGILDAQMYFDHADSTESQIVAYADSLYRRMNWALMSNYQPGIYMGWMPGTGFLNYGLWKGYNEASIMYLLAIGSPTYPVDPSEWGFWVNGYSWVNYYEYHYVGFAPLFGHQYSQCWLDLRALLDSYLSGHGIDYFENSRRATYAQRAYAMANPNGYTAYSDTLWGFTAGDGPHGYIARGAPPPQNDDGTLSPTAPISSLPFAPEIVLPVIRNLWFNYHARLWTKYGFRDGFNFDQNWTATEVIGIDQGPIIIMIENYLNGRVWKRFMKHPAVQRGLALAGFVPVTQVATRGGPLAFSLDQNFPNPFNPITTIRYSLAQRSKVKLAVYDVLGREVSILVNSEQEAGNGEIKFDGTQLASGVYFYRLNAGRYTETRKFVLLR